MFKKLYANLCISFLQKNQKSSPRWQYNDAKRSTEIKPTTEVVEDERDPDVIPAQYGKFMAFVLL